MPAKLLILEDDDALSALLAYNLNSEGFETVFVKSGDDGLSAAKTHRPNLVILDWLVPGQSGIEVCRELRRNPETSDLPIIMLTAKGLPNDKILAFDAGVDDYVVKPFSVAELIARIHGLLRRAGTSAEMHRATGSLKIDEVSYKASFNDVEIVLTLTEFRMLVLFAQRRGRLLTRAQLIEHVWHGAQDVNERTVDIHVGHLRRALKTAGAPDVIRTARGAGYMLDFDDRSK